MLELISEQRTHLRAHLRALSQELRGCSNEGTRARSSRAPTRAAREAQRLRTMPDRPMLGSALLIAGGGWREDPSWGAAAPLAGATLGAAAVALGAPTSALHSVCAAQWPRATRVRPRATEATDDVLLLAWRGLEIVCRAPCSRLGPAACALQRARAVALIGDPVI